MAFPWLSFIIACPVVASLVLLWCLLTAGHN